MAMMGAQHKTSPSKSSRVEARVTPERKAYYERAAALEGTSFTEFVTRALDRAADEAMYRHEVIQLSRRDSRAFMDALLNPGEPGERLLRAARRHGEAVGE